MTKTAWYLLGAVVCAVCLVIAAHERGEKADFVEATIALCLGLFWPLIALASVPFAVKAALAFHTREDK